MVLAPSEAENKTLLGGRRVGGMEIIEGGEKGKGLYLRA